MSNKKIKQIRPLIITASDNERKLELHFNLWESRANDIHCLDIGVMCPIDEAKDYDVHLRVPGTYKKDKVKNLGMILKKEIEVTSNVFNDIVSLDVTENYATVTRNEKPNDPFYLELEDPDVQEQDSNAQKIKDETEIVLHVSKDNPGNAKKRYFRYRIENFDISAISDFESSKASPCEQQARASWITQP